MELLHFEKGFIGGTSVYQAHLIPQDLLTLQHYPFARSNIFGAEFFPASTF